MDNQRIYLVEDNQSYSLELEMFAEELGHEIVGASASAEAAIVEILALQPDLIVMDINLAGEMTGLDLAQSLESTHIPILFITVHDRAEFFEKAQKTNWAGYLVKPFDKLSFQAAIEVAARLKALVKESSPAPIEGDIIYEDCILVKVQGVYHKVRFEDIYYVQTEGNYSTIFTADRKFALKTSLKQLLERLAESDFVQVHKSYVIQMSRLDAIDAYTHELILGAYRIPMGKAFREALLKRFKVLK